MAYRDDIAALSPDHHWPFESGADLIGAATATAAIGAAFTGTAVTEDAAASLTVTDRAGRATVINQTDMNTTAIAQRAMGGWFRVDSVQTPPIRVYGEGDTTASLQFILGFGNFMMVELFDGAEFVTAVQTYTDRPLEVNRPYHVFCRYEGSGTTDLLELWLDGVLVDTSPLGGVDLDAHATAPAWGDSTAATASGGSGNTLVTVSATNCEYAHWASWSGANAAALTTTSVRETLFENGALPTNTITSDTEANMQTALTGLGAAAIGNVPLSLRVEDSTTAGADITLASAGLQFDELSSIHVQWMGTGTLTFVNSGASPATSASTPNGGTVVFAQEVTVTVTALDSATSAPIENARVRVVAAAGGPLAAGALVLSGLTNASGVLETTTFFYTADQPVTGRVRKSTTPDPLYKTGDFSDTVASSGLSVTVFMEQDE